MKTPLHITVREITIPGDNQSSLVIPAGSFVKIIEKKYVPKHVIDRGSNQSLNLDIYVYCYTHFGIHPLRYDWLRRDE